MTASIRAYYAAFNAGDHAGMLATVTEDVAHDVNQGARQTGKDAFAAFLRRMDRCYREQVAELVVMTEPSGQRAAAEFVILGTYVQTDPGYPPATGQSYRLPVVATFALREGLIARVSTYYNVPDWLAQISG